MKNAIIIVKNTIVIKDIDFDMLKKQKTILINMIQDWGEADDENQKKDAKEAEGIIYLIDAIQDYAVDKLGMKESDVFNIDKELNP